MKINRTKQKLKDGGHAIGTMIKEAVNINIAETLKLAGFDFFVIDMEHATHSMPMVSEILLYARKCDITGIVRVPQLGYSYVARALDMGADGIWVPHVDIAQEARQLVAFGKYPPEGRGAAVPLVQTIGIPAGGEP